MTPSRLAHVYPTNQESFPLISDIKSDKINDFFCQANLLLKLDIDSTSLLQGMTRDPYIHL